MLNTSHEITHAPTEPDKEKELRQGSYVEFEMVTSLLPLPPRLVHAFVADCFGPTQVDPFQRVSSATHSNSLYFVPANRRGIPGVVVQSAQHNKRTACIRLEKYDSRISLEKKFEIPCIMVICLSDWYDVLLMKITGQPAWPFDESKAEATCLCNGLNSGNPRNQVDAPTNQAAQGGSLEHFD